MPLIRSWRRPLVRLLLAAAALGSSGCSGPTEPPPPSGATTAIVTFQASPTDQDLAALAQRGAVKRRILVSAHAVVAWSTTTPDELARVPGTAQVLDLGPVADPDVLVSLHFSTPVTAADLARVQQAVGHAVQPQGDSDITVSTSLGRAEQLDGWARVATFWIGDAHGGGF